MFWINHFKVRQMSRSFTTALMNKFLNSKLVYQSSASGGAFISFEKQNILVNKWRPWSRSLLKRTWIDQIFIDRQIRRNSCVRCHGVADWMKWRVSHLRPFICQGNNFWIMISIQPVDVIIHVINLSCDRGRNSLLSSNNKQSKSQPNFSSWPQQMKALGRRLYCLMKK